MSRQVSVSQKVLFSLGGLLVVSLVTIGFLLGRQSGAPGAQATPSSSPHSRSAPIPLVGQAEPTLDSRVNALEGRVGTLHQRAGQPTKEATPGDAQADNNAISSADLEAQRAYFVQLDAILGTSAFASPQPFATRLLEQAMMGDDTKFEAISNQTKQAARDVEAIQAPPTCREHRELVLAQLSDAFMLLEEVKLATKVGDTAKLEALSIPEDETMKDALRLRKLDHSLR